MELSRYVQSEIPQNLSFDDNALDLRSGTEEIQRGAALRRRAQRPTRGISQGASRRGLLNKF